MIQLYILINIFSLNFKDSKILLIYLLYFYNLSKKFININYYLFRNIYDMF